MHPQDRDDRLIYHSVTLDDKQVGTFNGKGQKAKDTYLA